MKPREETGARVGHASGIEPVDERDVPKRVRPDEDVTDAIGPRTRKSVILETDWIIRARQVRSR